MHEIRFYLQKMLEAIDTDKFDPTFFVVVFKDGLGTLSLKTYDKDILNEISALLNDYDDNMCLITDTTVSVANLLVV